MQFLKPAAELIIPDGAPAGLAASRTTDLCIAAHQDDVEIMAYGPIVDCYGREDRHFSAVVVTDGAGSPRSGIYARYTDEQMKSVRIKEQKNAAVIGEYAALYLLSHSSAQVKDPKNAALIQELAEFLRQTRPRTVYTHYLADKHDTHVAVALRTIAAVRSLSPETRPSRVVTLEVWRGLDWVVDEEKTVFDTGLHPNLANALLGVFDSQIAGGKRYDLASVSRRIANATYYASHDVDDAESLSFGLDITGAVNDDALSPAQIIDRYMESFRHDVLTRIGRLE